MTSGTPIEQLSETNDSQLYDEYSHSQYHTGDFNRTSHAQKTCDLKQAVDNAENKKTL